MEKKTGNKTLTACDWCVLVGAVLLLASLVNPTISQAVEEKRLTDMVDRLQRVRANIQLYQAAHDGLLPGQRFFGASVTSEQFAAAMAEPAGKDRSPFLRQIPANPYVESSALSRTITCVNDLEAKPTGNEGTAWWFNAATGDFYACDSKFHTNY